MFATKRTCNWERNIFSLKLESDFGERAFHLKLLKDPLYMEEMQAVLEDEYQYQYFQMVTVMG